MYLLIISNSRPNKIIHSEPSTNMMDGTFMLHSFLIFLSILPNYYAISPKKIKKRGELQAETMVEIAKSLQGLNSNILTPEQEYEKNVLKDIHEKVKQDANMPLTSLNSINSQASCALPSYARNYSKECPEGFTFPIWGKGFCYFSGGLEHHGVALVDFRAMSVDEKKAWESENCLFFPRMNQENDTRDVAQEKKQTVYKQKEPDFLRKATQKTNYPSSFETSSSKEKMSNLPILQGPVRQKNGEIVTSI